jgi:hypothetical protein
VLVDANGPWAAPLATFRSSGRFGWPLMYVVVVWAVVRLAHLRPPVSHAVLAAVLALQVADLRDAYRFRYDAARDPAFHARDQRLATARWTTIAPHYRHIELVPAPHCGEPPLPYEPAMRLAADHALTVNAGVIARRDLAAQRRYCLDADAAIDAVALRDDTLYLVTAAAARILGAAGANRVRCGAVDGVTLCTTAAAHARWAADARFD